MLGRTRVGNRWIRRAGGVLALCGAIGLLQATATAAPSEPDETPTAEQGRYLRLDASPSDFPLLSPGAVVDWQVGVGVLDAPTSAEVLVGLDVDGSMTNVPDGMTLTVDWCADPWQDGVCDSAAPVLPTTPVSDLGGQALDLDGAGEGWLLVVVAVPKDAPAAAQGREAHVLLGVRARGEEPSDDPSADDPPTDDAPIDDVPADDKGAAAPPTTGEPGPGMLPTLGAPLLGPALLAVASVATGIGLTAARRLRHRHRSTAAVQR